jgi:hypothetical protein
VDQVRLLSINLSDVTSCCVQLGLDIALLGNDLLKLDDGRVELEDLLALSYKDMIMRRVLLLIFDSRSLIFNS